ncbi:sulfatase-like hydrolase/transferase [Sphingomonas sp. LY54]|uniref:sulfatase-like hydrolase/transferase n=1 Tax=Sphingomonas sp. LY54 TaxID=3095343 RepID=UPI002D77A0F1|nr:sulfatase-like hydrolase/transferase [Sphingomonas sp. LY54]WRP29416.1 sulfatase-like hydrolase/transferase [Sphingomonas sp. LY54]
MYVALDQPWSIDRPAPVRSLANWLLCWVFLPNVVFAWGWVVGGPARSGAVLVTAAVGVVLHRARFPLKLCGFVAALAYAALYYIGSVFNLSIVSLVHSLKFAAELSPAASSEYVVGALALSAVAAAAWFRLRRSTELAGAGWMIAAAGAACLVGAVDAHMVARNGTSWTRIPEPGAPFGSAVARSGLLAAADGKRHMVVVMVESLGLPTDPKLRDRLVSLFARPAARARYDIAIGDTPFYGSTTSGEMRELCGRWADYAEILEASDPTCLPARLAARGYGTQAWHSFNGSFFDRSHWYPGIGFQQMRFAPELLAGGAAPCPGVFTGACDRDVPRQMALALKEARRPQFLYWLTVNSHLPVMAHARLGTDDCDRFDRDLGRQLPMVCRLFALIDQTGAALEQEIVAKDFPPADILIVGDHLPPFFDPQHRGAFAGDRVPWILLRTREPG